MNTDQANRVRLSEILAKLGYLLTKRHGNESWYLSPLRNEKTASFRVRERHNDWRDFGVAKSGTAIDFVCAYLESRGEDHTVSDALRWLRNMHFEPSHPGTWIQETLDRTGSLLVRKITPVQTPDFLNYLQGRGIPLPTAHRYLKEISLHNKNTDKQFSAIGLPNVNGGYELRNEYFKGSTSPKGISLIRGKQTLPDEVHIFEGYFDFLSALCHQKSSAFDCDSIILNSVTCISQAYPYIKNYSYKKINTWLDNDKAGETATDTIKDFAAENKFDFEAMNSIYHPHKDVNEWHMDKLGLKKSAKPNATPEASENVEDQKIVSLPSFDH